MSGTLFLMKQNVEAPTMADALAQWPESRRLLIYCLSVTQRRTRCAGSPRGRSGSAWEKEAAACRLATRLADILAILRDEVSAYLTRQIPARPAALETLHSIRNTSFPAIQEPV